MLNQQIGPYKIISKLGEGGMANVYLAEKGTLSKKVALKVLKDEFLLNREVRKRFLDEPKKMIQLNHPNIVGVQDLINKPDFVAIELDYIEGKTLKQHLKEKGGLSKDEIQHLFQQMLDALACVHKNGFVHRDVKPSNFMLTGNGIIKLIDFGIAKDVDYNATYTKVGLKMGTTRYMSPEQVKSTKDVDYRTDIYSLGVVLWEMVTGRVPYDIEEDSEFETSTKVVKENLALTNTYWDKFIIKATQKNVEHRFSKIPKLRVKSTRKIDSLSDFFIYLKKSAGWIKVFSILSILSCSICFAFIYINSVINYYDLKSVVLELSILITSGIILYASIILLKMSLSIQSKSFNLKKFLKMFHLFWKLAVISIILFLIIIVGIGLIV